MERTVSIKLCNRIECCVGDMAYMTVKATQKLVSYGSACESSEVPALITGVGMNSDGTFTYVVRYQTTVLREQCNYLLPEDISGLCCAECCEPPKCVCNDPCVKPAPCDDKCTCGNCLPKQTVTCNHTRNNSCSDEPSCVNIIRGVNCGR